MALWGDTYDWVDSPILMYYRQHLVDFVGFKKRTHEVGREKWWSWGYRRNCRGGNEGVDLIKTYYMVYLWNFQTIIKYEISFRITRCAIYCCLLLVFESQKTQIHNQCNSWKSIYSAYNFIIRRGMSPLWHDGGMSTNRHGSRCHSLNHKHNAKSKLVSIF